MRYLIFCFALSIVVVSCKKETASNQMVSTQNLKNTKWELRKSEGSIAGNFNYQPGNGQTIEFFGVDSFIAVYPISSISPADSGTYTIANAVNSGDFNLTRKYFRNGYAMTANDSIRFVNNQLVFLAHYGWADEPTIYYDKL
jgi:hypothetical protein